MKNKKPDVLVLNRSWIPIHIIVWERCMSLIVQEAALPLDRDFVSYDFKDWVKYSFLTKDYPTINTIQSRIAIPEIIVLKKFDKLPVRDVKFSRQTLFQRDKNRCGYCGIMFDRRELTIDHIIPRSKGGTSNWSNTVTCCKPCNYKKADQTLEQSGMKLLVKPKKPVWLSPLYDVKPNHPCKSWLRFLDRALVDIGE